LGTLIIFLCIALKRRGQAAVIRVAINGFGRIGRNFLRCWLGRTDSGLEVVGINDTSDPRSNAHLLKYDSMLGKLNANIDADDNSLIVNGKTIKCYSDRNPLNLPWAEWGVDLVIEATGVFVDEEGASKHIVAGAKKVLITAPGKGSGVGTYVVGVNAHEYEHDKYNVISNASCTTNCLAPVVKVIHENFGIIKGTMTTTHSYTGDQRILDASHRDLRRARAAAVNIQVEKSTIAEQVNEVLKEASENSLKGILEYNDLPLVSSDYRGVDASSIIDASLTMVMGGDMVKVIAWYDNEWGYSQRVVDLAEVVASKWKG